MSRSLREPALLERHLDPGVDAASGPQQRPRGAMDPRGDVEVLQHRELLEHARGLERAAHPQPDDLLGGLPQQFLTAERHRPGPLGQTRDGVDAGRLSRTVRPDEESDLTGVGVERHSADGDESIEFDREIGDDERTLRGGHFFTSSTTGSSTGSAAVSSTSAGSASDAGGASRGRHTRPFALPNSEDSPMGRKRVTRMKTRPRM